MMRAKCEECGGRIQRKAVDYSYVGEHIGKFEAEVCTKCHEVVFDERASAAIERKVKEKHLYGLGSTTKVGVAGSSVVIRITKRLAEFLQIHKGNEVHVYPESKNRIVIETSR